MGAMWFDKGGFADHLHEIVGYKAGVAASIEYMCDLLSGTAYPDDIIGSEQYGLRIRSEDYEELYYHLLHKVGTTEKPYGGIFEIFSLTTEFRKLGGDQFSMDIFNIYHSHIEKETEIARKEGHKSLDPHHMIQEAYERFGVLGLKSIFRIIEEFERLRRFNPHSMNRWQEWKDVLNLADLFTQQKPVVTEGMFFDQRFIDFLSVNHEKIGAIHWRKFEELVGECFDKFGYKVELGPGTNDDGVDLRVWSDQFAEIPEYIIQCKRQKAKIEKVTVKGLYADVLHEGAKMGLLVTTSEFSPGARKTVSARSYPVEEVNGQMIKSWLQELRTPGTGIVRV